MLEEKKQIDVTWEEGRTSMVGKEGNVASVCRNRPVWHFLAFLWLSVKMLYVLLQAKCPRLTGINRMHVHLWYFSWSRAPCASFLKAAICIGPLSSQDLWLFWMAMAPWRRTLCASSTSEHWLKNGLSGWMPRWAANFPGKEYIQPSVQHQSGWHV